jgi:hypothetical protein
MPLADVDVPLRKRPIAERRSAPRAGGQFECDTMARTNQQREFVPVKRRRKAGRPSRPGHDKRAEDEVAGIRERARKRRARLHGAACDDTVRRAAAACDAASDTTAVIASKDVFLIASNVHRRSRRSSAAAAVDHATAVGGDVGFTTSSVALVDYKRWNPCGAKGRYKSGCPVCVPDAFDIRRQNARATPAFIATSRTTSDVAASRR